MFSVVCVAMSSTSVFFVVCVAMSDWAVPDFVSVVCELQFSITFDFDVGLFPKRIFGNFVCFDPVISSLASVTCVFDVEFVGEFVFFVCLPFPGGRLYHLGSERLSSRSDVLFQSTETVRPRGLVIFNSAGMNPSVNFFVSFRLIVLNWIALIEVLLKLRFFRFESVD